MNTTRRNILVFAAGAVLVASISFAAPAITRMLNAGVSGALYVDSSTARWVSPNGITRTLEGSIDYDFPDSGATAVCNFTPEVTVTGAQLNDVCVLGPSVDGGFVDSYVMTSCAVTKADKVRVKCCNLNANADPADAGYHFRIFSYQ